MKDKHTFIDSNVVLYLFDANNERKQLITSFLTPEYTISTQVINENVNICLRKLKFEKIEAYAHGNNLMNVLNVVQINSSIIANAFYLSIKYKFGYWDSLILSSALESNCKILLSEYMSDGQLIEGKLRISNPFKLIPIQQLENI